MLRMVQPANRLWLPPAIVTAMPRANSKVSPRNVTLETPVSETIGASSSDSPISFPATGDGGQK